ncbi:MAG TPA: hypothetical protein PLE54_11010 [Burkholderiaceae bacterium]|nr:hypothetical protein [Burkholderiaceae bacterium]HQR71124.1 hypothetical protein [Burkholderiaceae bacterium]
MTALAMRRRRRSAMATALLFAALAFAGSWAPAAMAAQADVAQSTTAASSYPTSVTRKKSPYRPEGVPRSGRTLLAVTSGVDDLRVRRTNAGNLIRFSYRVTNAELAKALNDRQSTPYMIGHTSHAMLQVPVMDKVGPLRQSTRAENGKDYWMMFSNKGDLVKAGERVSVVIGSFRVDGLLVE